VLAIGAAVVLAVLGILFILNMYLPALIISLMGLVIGVYGILHVLLNHRYHTPHIRLDRIPKFVRIKLFKYEVLKTHFTHGEVLFKVLVFVCFVW
jgi:energy-converting hydrogenase Eha subunit G